MDGADERLRPRLSFKQRLGFKGLGCCGLTWSFHSNTIPVDLDSPQPEEFTVTESTTTTTTNTSQSQTTDPDCLLSAIPVSSPTTSGMNLAAALAAERQFRELTIANEGGGRVMAPATPLRVSLLRLLEETEDEITEKETVTVGNDSLCCVCMGRKKGAAFIPCGHTFCRVCSRELWLNRGFCPLCNRSILEVLDIF